MSTSSSESVVNENLKRKRNKQTNNSNTPDEHASADSDDELENADEQGPVLSHAEKRRKKREAKRAEKLKDGDDHPKKKRKLEDGTSQIADSSTTTTTTTKRQNSVWVGNLSYKTQHENLQDFFKWVGDITRIHMPTKVRGGPGAQPENRGFAYVDFATPEAKIAAVALSEQPLLGRKLLIKDGDDFEGRPAAATLEAVVTDPSIAHKTHSKTAQKILSAQKQPAAPTLFFGNLPFQTTEDAIRQLLDAHRPRDKKKAKEGEDDDEESQKEDCIRKIRMGTFEDSGLCKGFAFVDFRSIDSSTAALINPKNHHLNGRDLVVEFASPDAVRRGGGAVPRKRRPLSAGYKKTRGRKKDKEAVQDGKKLESAAQDHGHPPHTGKDSRNKKKVGNDSEGVDPFLTGKGAERVKEREPKSRPKPGAALAQAKRETAAIVPSQGKKIVF